MAKRRTPERKKSEKKVEQIDMLPRYYQQPRSSPPKRRTDFSLFFSYSSSPSNPESFFRKIGFSSTTIDSLDDLKARMESPVNSLVQCSKFQEEGLQQRFNGTGIPVSDVEAVSLDAPLDLLIDSTSDKVTRHTGKTMKYNPKKSGVSESSEVCVAPGSIVWAKTAHQMWWPAEVMGERSMSDDSPNQGMDGYVLVHFYGSGHSDWVDPTRDISQFEEYFEERSGNSTEEFQDALRQALNRKEHLCSSIVVDQSESSDQRDQSFDKWASSISSRTEDDDLERGRGKRERKPRLRFDEVTLPLKSTRKLRRFKIMRSLGLAAPIGSPF